MVEQVAAHLLHGLDRHVQHDARIQQREKRAQRIGDCKQNQVFSDICNCGVAVGELSLHNALHRPVDRPDQQRRQYADRCRQDDADCHDDQLCLMLADIAQQPFCGLLDVLGLVALFLFPFFPFFGRHVFRVLFLSPASFALCGCVGFFCFRRLLRGSVVCFVRRGFFRGCGLCFSCFRRVFRLRCFRRCNRFLQRFFHFVFGFGMQILFTHCANTPSCCETKIS